MGFLKFTHKSICLLVDSFNNLVVVRSQVGRHQGLDASLGGDLWHQALGTGHQVSTAGGLKG